MPRKTFRVAAAVEPISFDLEGPIRGIQNFPCRDRMAAGSLMRFAEMFSSIKDEAEGSPEAASDGAKAIPAIRQFFDSALQKEGRSRFWDMINDDDEGIPLDTLVEVAGWLAEVYSGGRPTGTNSGSTSEGTSTGDGSPATPSAGDIVEYSRPSQLTSSTTS
ncbi:hypothetical protein [Longimicrobium sp.]|uniref:hypothetical protein n=1 Tax=Longimicrobium sp. TaxID=2029185 RepID=UPI002ED99B34